MADNNLLRTKLAHKEELIALHNHYRAVIDGLTSGKKKKLRRG